jgi:hypothetical protein
MGFAPPRAIALCARFAIGFAPPRAMALFSRFAIGFAPPRAMALCARFAMGFAPPRAIALVLVTVVLKEIRMILRCRCRFTVSHTYLHTILT